MSQQSETPFKLFRVDSGLSSHQAHAICTAFRNPGGYLKGESFVLIQLSPTEGKVLGSKFSYSNNAGQDFPIAIDEKFAMDDALFQAESIYLSGMNEISPTASSQPGWKVPSFVEIPQHRLVSIWAHTPLSHPLLKIADSTGCEPLNRLIYALQSLPTVKRSPLAL